MKAPRRASDRDRAASDEAKVVEIRVHGIGDHDDWSALGSPGLATGGVGTREPDVALPPTHGPHALRLVNWSRTSRRTAGLLWYVALPYSLINTAGYMSTRSRADSDRTDGPSRLRAVAGGALMTLLTYAWTVATLETLARYVFTAQTSSRWFGPTLAGSVGLALCLGMGFRSRAQSIPPGVRNVNVGLVVAASVAAAWGRPAQFDRVDGGPLAGILFTAGLCHYEGDGSIVVIDLFYFDPLIATTILCVVGSLLLSSWAWWQGARSPDGAAYGGQAICLAAATILFVTVASSVRLFLDNALNYLAGRDLLPGQSVRVPGVPLTADPEARTLLPHLLNYCGRPRDNLLDVLPGMGFVAVGAFVIALLAANRLRGGPAASGSAVGRADSALRRALWVHRLVESLARTLPLAIALAAVLWWAATAWVYWAWLTGWSVRVGLVVLVLMLVADGVLVVVAWVRGTRMVLVLGAGLFILLTFAALNKGLTVDWRTLTAVGVQVLSAATMVFILLSRSTSKTHVVLSSTADIIGFWPPQYHPFAGASYRDGVIETITAEIERPRDRVVLVGHSQGSVLCAWTVHGLGEQSPALHPPGKLALVTCGSPLRSLYGTFFPGTFDEAFFARVRSRASWANFWRETDPISTTLPGLESEPLADPPQEGGGPLLGHGDYWIATEQVAWVERMLTG